MTTPKAICGFALAVVFFAGLAAHGGEPDKDRFTLTPDEYGSILKAPDGRVVFRYMTKKPSDTALTANSVCCFYPLNTPSGERVVDFAPSDHPHHRGMFLAWHSITNGKKADFWGWGEWAPTKGRVITNRRIRLVESDAATARLRIRNDWMIEDEALIRELLNVVVREEKGSYVIDLHFQLTPTEDVTLDRTAFGGLCVKARKDGKPVYADPKGEVKLPDPHYLKPETDWPAADWYDYTTRLDSGKTVGVAILNHPDNPPTAWHNLAPIAMVNPCIVAPGPVALKKGEPLHLRYGIVVHDGATPVDLLNTLSKELR
jgi:hypothetical protein